VGGVVWCGAVEHGDEVVGFVFAGVTYLGFFTSDIEEAAYWYAFVFGLEG
jgi:hypothetical protein